MDRAGGGGLARDGFVEEAVLERTPRRRDSDDLVTLVALAVRTLENPTLANIARHLEHLHCRTPRGETRWSISSAQNLLAQAVEQGLLPDRPLPSPTAPRRCGRPPKSLKPAVTGADARRECLKGLTVRQGQGTSHGKVEARKEKGRGASRSTLEDGSITPAIERFPPLTSIEDQEFTGDRKSLASPEGGSLLLKIVNENFQGKATRNVATW